LVSRAGALDPTDLHSGDFVTVTATGTGDELVARSIDVVRPARDLSKATSETR
jgi:hypothetical protein